MTNQERTANAGPRRRRRRRAAVAVSVVVLLGAVATTATVLALRQDEPGHAGLARAAFAGPAVPAGKQPVSFHGVQVFVPASWREHDTTTCGTPIHDTFLLSGSGGSPGCADTRPQPADITVVRMLGSDEPDGRALAAVATSTTTVDGHPATTGYGRPRVFPHAEYVLSVPHPGVVVSVAGPDAAVARAILDSARIVPVDSAGCRDRVAPLAPSGRTTVAGASERLVPGQPVSAAVCRYASYWLARSLALSGPQIDDLRRTLDALPAGATPGATPATESSDACAEDAQRGFVVRFSYADGSWLDVVAHIGGCSALSASNGSRTTTVDAALVTALTRLVGYDGGIPDLFASTTQQVAPPG